CSYFGSVESPHMHARCPYTTLFRSGKADLMRIAGLALAFWLAAVPTLAQEITAAEYSEPTTRYPHGALGDDEEWGTLRITVSRKDRKSTRLNSSHVKISYAVFCLKK